MHEIALQYLGKKAPFKFENKKKGLSLVFGSEPVWVYAKGAEWLMEVNPKMFKKVDERNPVELMEDAADIIKAKAKADEPDMFDTFVPETNEPDLAAEIFTCEKCKREYKDKSWYDKHVAKCEG